MTVAAAAGCGDDRQLSGFGGYRYLYVDYDSDNFLYRVGMHGPIIGATLRF